MAQTVCFVQCNGILSDEVFNYTPSHDDFVQICKDMGLGKADDWVDVEYEKMEIGPGEYGADTFLNDDVFVHIRSVTN